jgi:hypothetical protein
MSLSSNLPFSKGKRYFFLNDFIVEINYFLLFQSFILHDPFFTCKNICKCKIIILGHLQIRPKQQFHLSLEFGKFPAFLKVKAKQPRLFSNCPSTMVFSYDGGCVEIKKNV